MLHLAMIITVTAFKGGVGKTTSAVHLATYLSRQAPTVLVDGDLIRSATRWSRRGKLPFPVVGERQLGKAVREHEHVIIDTQARPEPEDIEELAAGCDLLVVPTTPDIMALEGVILTIGALKEAGGEGRYKVLLTMVPPKPSREGEEARLMPAEDAVLPVFRGQVRRLVAFRKAALEGIPVYEVNDPRAAWGWEDYKEVGNEAVMAER
jgi:chromosome partitioning protein